MHLTCLLMPSNYLVLIAVYTYFAFTISFTNKGLCTPLSLQQVARLFCKSVGLKGVLIPFLHIRNSSSAFLGILKE